MCAGHPVSRRLPPGPFRSAMLLFLPPMGLAARWPLFQGTERSPLGPERLITCVSATRLGDLVCM